MVVGGLASVLKIPVALAHHHGFREENGCRLRVELYFYSKTIDNGAISFKNRETRAFEANRHLKAERRRARTRVF